MPPKFEGDKDEYLNWMADLESWLVCTHIEKANQALAIRMRLGGPPKDIANELDAGDLRVPEEVDGTGVGLRIGGIPKPSAFAVSAATCCLLVVISVFRSLPM